MAVQRRREPRYQETQEQPSTSRAAPTTTTTTTIPTITTTATRSVAERSQERSFSQIITIDLLLKVLHRTLFHPFIAWIIVLCLRAQVTPFDHPAFILATAWASILTLLAAANVINRRIAYGTPRAVDLNEEVIVVTGGASGLGLLIAQIYGLRGASVAVLDVKEVSEIAETWEEGVSGVEYYRCDVGNRKEVEATRARIVKDVSWWIFPLFRFIASIEYVCVTNAFPVIAGHSNCAGELRCGENQWAAAAVALRRSFSEDDPHQSLVRVSHMPDLLTRHAGCRERRHHRQCQFRARSPMRSWSVGLRGEQGRTQRASSDARERIESIGR